MFVTGDGGGSGGDGGVDGLVAGEPYLEGVARGCRDSWIDDWTMI